tara:strand:+ start:763 stop:1977 length:1215 start_codon:yes stop_codon:yes gene_type:complete
MKSFRQVIAEVAQPNSPEEKAFKDQHTYEVASHPVALDAQFTGDIAPVEGDGSPKAARPADQKGSANYDLAYPYGMNAAIDGAFAEAFAEPVNENAEEEIPMMSQQLDFISMAAKAIKESLKGGGDPEEWYQGKLGTAHDAMKTLHANIETDSVDESEMATKKALDDASASSKEGKKAVSLKKAPWEKTEALVGGQKELDHDKDGDIDGDDFAKLRAKKKKKNESVEELEEYSNWKIQHPTKSTKSYTVKARNTGEAIKKGHAAAKKAGDMHPASDNRMFKPKHIQKEDLDETTMSALKKGVTTTGTDGKTRTIFKTTKDNKTDERGQDKITTNEGTESLDEAFAQGILKFKDGKQMILKKEDANVLNKMFKKMSSGSVKKMTETAMKDKAGFAEILSFAKEAL